ncbi:MAG: DUF302 domain-containing protein [Gammaproteobacteria bacterium]|nr:MAG: DUF302 domain-containing protein [Gammaproteobacteria bacterium]
MLDLCLYLSTKEREMKNKLSVILAITGTLTMGSATADWGNNNNYYNPFSGGNSFGPFGGNTSFGPFGGGNGYQPFGFNRFGPMNGNNMGPFNGGHNWQNQSFNPMKVAQQAADTVQETVSETVSETAADSNASPKMTADLFMQMIQVTEVDEDITGPEVDESIKSMATNESILHVAMFPLSEQIKNVTGKPYRHLSIHNICDAATAGKIADIDDRYAVILPCRIAVVEGKDGKIRMISMNPDVMHAMKLPEDALGPAMDVAEKMNAILEGAKEGSF